LPPYRETLYKSREKAVSGLLCRGYTKDTLTNGGLQNPSTNGRKVDPLFGAEVTSMTFTTNGIPPLWPPGAKIYCNLPISHYLSQYSDLPSKVLPHVLLEFIFCNGKIPFYLEFKGNVHTSLIHL